MGVILPDRFMPAKMDKGLLENPLAELLICPLSLSKGADQ